MELKSQKLPNMRNSLERKEMRCIVGLLNFN